MNHEQLLKDIKHVRSLSRKRRKKKKESDLDFLIKKNHSCCQYCRKSFAKKDLLIVKMNVNKPYSSNLTNGAIACYACSDDKGGLNHYQYLSLIKKRKKKVRSEVTNNYVRLKKAVLKKYNYTCIYCVHEFGFMPKERRHELTIDHKIPVSKGGTNDINNLGCSCQTHNTEKRDFSTNEYINYLKRKKEMV